MPLPTRNPYFQDGTLDGLVTHGTVRIVESFDAIHHAHRFLPVRGKYLIVLDDPWNIDGDGSRAPAPGDPPPADTSTFSILPDANGQTTLGVDGAILECRDVTLRPGDSIWFHWAFARFDWSPANDFALFTASSGSGAASQTVYTLPLVQSIDLERRSLWYTDWHVCSWRPTAPFSGTLRWIVSNGMSTTVPISRPGGGARPSALLLDCIEVG